MSYKNIILEEGDGGIATLTINRPERMNSISIETVGEMVDAFKRLAGDDGLRALVLTGAGDRAFCAGADIADMAPRPQKDAGNIVRLYLDYVLALRNLPVPVIARINGVAAGGGCCTALACDIRVASEGARFGFIFHNVGLTAADLGATYFLPRLVGYGKAAELLLLAELIDAREALRIGLVNRVVPHDQLDTAVDTLVQRLAAGPPRATRFTKQALNQSLDGDVDAEFEFEVFAQTACLLSEDHMEGVRAFREKRTPVFQGR